MISKLVPSSIHQSSNITRTMTTTSPTWTQTNQTITPPWKFLGSVSSVSPATSFEDASDSTTVKPQGSYNGTGYYIDDDGESVLSDLKTVLMACVATLAPLVIIVMTIFGVRIMWIQYKTRKKARHFDGNSEKRNSMDSTTKPLHSHLLNDKDSTDTHLDISTEAEEICEDLSTSQHNRPNNINGSIITMTLKNNHLIVETEERNDIEEDSRETTVRYSPSARDGVFVVEVQQGVRRSPGSGGPTSITEPERSGSLSDECALVHNPPERFSDEETIEECDDSEYSPKTGSQKISLTDISTQAKTGLSASNSSLSSQRHSYCYTSQYCYDQGNYGYNIYLGYPNNTSSGRIAENNKPKITSALYKTNATRGVKSMSFDVDSNGRLREKLVLSHNSSLDNVLESNGFEEFSSNLYKSKLLTEQELSLSESSGELEVKTDVDSK